MNNWPKKFPKRYRSTMGFSMAELLIVVAVVMLVAALAIPNITRIIYNVKLRSTAGDLGSLMQQARILAAKNNATYAIGFVTVNGTRAAYIDLNGNAARDAGEPDMQFTGTTSDAANAPSGTGGQPAAYLPVGDTSVGTPYDNTNVLAFSPRGLPCEYSAPPACATPAAKYFIFYINDIRPGGGQGWAAVVVSKAGRTRTVVWDGATWH